MPGRPAWRQQNPDGSITVIYEDGSFVRIDTMTGAVKEQNDSPNPMRAAAFASGDKAAIDRVQEAASNEDARRFGVTSGQADRGLELQANQIDNAYRINMMNAQTQQDAQRATEQYQKDQAQLARERLAWDREYGQAGLGMRMVETSANLTGPDKVFEAFDLNRGYGSMQGTPSFLSALRNNTQLRGFGAQGGAPDPLTMDSLMAKMQPGYGGSAEAQTTQNALGAISDIGTAGAHKIGAGVMESLNDSERAAFMSGLGKAGFDRGAFLADWRNSRIGQSIAGSRAA